MKRCPDCGSVYEDNLKFCIKDGAALIEEEEAKLPKTAAVGGMTCPSCGAVYADNVKFCIKDGSPLVSTGDVVSEPRPVLSVPKNSPEPKERKRKSKVPVIILAVLILLLVALGVLFALNWFGLLPFDLPFDLPVRQENVDEEEPEEETETNEVENADTDITDMGAENAIAESEKETEVDEAETVEEARESEPDWRDAFLAAVDGNASDFNAYAICDIDGDGTPELICKNSDKASIEILRWEGGEETESIMESEGATLGCDVDEGRLFEPYIEDGVAYDRVYKINGLAVSTEFNGQYRQSKNNPYDKEGNPNMDYTIGGDRVDESDYFEHLHELCYDRELLDLGELASAGRTEISDYLASAAPDGETWPVDTDTDDDLEMIFSFEESAQLFEAPHAGIYRFSLYGANGGTDDFRDYAAEGAGATLVGTMELALGQRVVILTGGAGDSAVSKAGAVAGGFNGGGAAYWSGGGGGCTDIYFEGVRVAAAAGSGGGNYEETGRPGRTSESSDKNVTSSKYGSGNARIDGGGGGGGWLGGEQGKKDKAGTGGVNGWNSDYFTMESEEKDSAYKNSGSFDGSVLIERR